MLTSNGLIFDFGASRISIYDSVIPPAFTMTPDRRSRHRIWEWKIKRLVLCRRLASAPSSVIIEAGQLRGVCLFLFGLPGGLGKPADVEMAWLAAASPGGDGGTYLLVRTNSCTQESSSRESRQRANASACVYRCRRLQHRPVRSGIRIRRRRARLLTVQYLPDSCLFSADSMYFVPPSGLALAG